MIETVTEYYELLERLRDLNFNGKLSKHLRSKLEAFQECEELINTLAIHSVSKSVALKYAQYCLGCDSEKIQIVSLDEYIEKHCC